MGAHQRTCCPRIDALQVFAKPLSNLLGSPSGGSRDTNAGPMLPELSTLVPCRSTMNDPHALTEAATAAVLMDALLGTWDCEASAAHLPLPTLQQQVAAAPPPAMAMALATALRAAQGDGGLRLKAAVDHACSSGLQRAVVESLQGVPTEGETRSQWDAWAWMHVWLQVCGMGDACCSARSPPPCWVPHPCWIPPPCWVPLPCWIPPLCWIPYHA